MSEYEEDPLVSTVSFISGTLGNIRCKLLRKGLKQYFQGQIIKGLKEKRANNGSKNITQKILSKATSLKTWGEQSNGK